MIDWKTEYDRRDSKNGWKSFTSFWMMQAKDEFDT